MKTIHLTLTNAEMDSLEGKVKLIDAAPELLIWLKAAQEHLKSYRQYSLEMSKIGRGHEPHSQFSSEYLDNGIEAAIAKAEGRQ